MPCQSPAAPDDNPGRSTAFASVLARLLRQAYDLSGSPRRCLRRNERWAWAEHKARLEFGVVPLVPAPVVAQVSRSPQQAQLRRFLTGCVVVSLGESEAHEAGRLLAITRTADVVDAVLVRVALRRKAIILTTDSDDIGRLVRASGCEVAVVEV